MRLSRRRGAARWVIGFAAIGLVAAACGGSSKKSNATGAGATTSTTATAETTATTAATAAESTTTTAAAAGGATATTAKATSQTTARATTKTTAKQFGSTNKQTVSGGISNVTAAPSTAPPVDVQPGGTLTYLKVSDGVGLDLTKIANSGNSDGPSAFMIYDALVYSNPDTGTVDPQTAQSLTSTDGLVWTLKIKPNIKFSDGTPYDAAAIKFNYQRLADPANLATRAQQAQLIKTMDVIDPVTLRMTLNAQNAVFPQSLALIPFIGSPTAIQTLGADKFNSAPIGAGPFILQSWVRDSQMVLVRNPTYWNAPLPYLDKIIIKPIGDENQRINSFKAGEANFLYTNLATSYQTLQAGGGVPNPSIINGGTLMYFNTRVKPFNDIRARQAVTMAIDRTDMSQVLDQGVLTPMNSAFRDNSPFFDPSTQQLGYDPTKAQQLFDQLAADTGGPLTFTLTAFNTGIYVPASQYIQSKLNGYRNVKVSVLLEASAVHQANTNTGNFTGLLTANPFDDPEPTWTAVFDCNNPTNPTGFCNQQYQTDAADQRATLDPNKRIGDIKDMQKLVYSQVPVFYFEHRAAWDFSAPNVKNVHLVNDGLALYDRIWIKSH
jgi:peptide/nickel transport system substrate-binding protein